MQPVTVKPGVSPVILAMPHTGTFVPPALWARLNDTGRERADTDWHIERLYDGLLPNATIVRATFHRYVIDANRDPSGSCLYPGQNTTGLVPQTDFDGQPIWHANQTPTATEIAQHIINFHARYHTALAAEIARIKALHGVAVLYDCHSIRAQIPFLFEGVLPDFNIGTNSGNSCAPEIESAVIENAAKATGYSHVVNGRFKGGWTTRHYGRPQEGTHAIQMELAQSTHLVSETQPFAYDSDKAAKLRPHLQRILQKLEIAAFLIKSQGGTP